MMRIRLYFLFVLAPMLAAACAYSPINTVAEGTGTTVRAEIPFVRTRTKS